MYPLARKVTIKYLYGTEEVPPDLLNPSLIRPSGVTTQLSFDIATHMNKETGPGRFALGPQFSFINRFFATTNPLQPGSYSKAQLKALWGLNNNDYDLGLVFQYNWADGYDDFVERVYVFGHESYRISDGATFVVTPQGDRYIQNFVVMPTEDNFDFITSEDAQAGNDLLLNANVDPSFTVQSKDPTLQGEKQGIGREVKLVFTGSNLPPVTYARADYDADRTKLSESQPFLSTGLSVFAARAQSSLLPDLWEAGITRFVTTETSPRAIL